MLLKTLAIVLGLVLIVFGILGFIPGLVQDGKLFDVFAVSHMYNLFYIISGGIALLCGISGSIASKIYFIIFGIIFLIVAILGFMVGEGMVLNLLPVNQADNILNIVIAVISLYFGFFFKASA